jgi:hypothetical protein
MTCCVPAATTHRHCFGILYQLDIAGLCCKSNPCHLVGSVGLANAMTAVARPTPSSAEAVAARRLFHSKPTTIGLFIACPVNPSALLPISTSQHLPDSPPFPSLQPFAAKSTGLHDGPELYLSWKYHLSAQTKRLTRKQSKLPDRRKSGAFLPCPHCHNVP